MILRCRACGDERSYNELVAEHILESGGETTCCPSCGVVGEVEQATFTGPSVAEATVGPWRYATLVIPCPVCAASPGRRCTWPDGRRRRRPHYERYAHARELAGSPLAPRRGSD